MMEFEG